MSDMLDKLAENRVPILLAEIGAYLHLIGRFSEKFIYAQAKDATDSEKDFNYEKVCTNPDFFENTGLDRLLKDQTWEILINAFKNLSNAGELFSHKIKSFSEFIEKHTWSNKLRGLCKILADAHGIISGIDKALAGRGESGKQRKAYTFKATAFGYEKEIELAKNPELKKTLFQKIKEILDNIKSKQDISYEEYLKFVSIMKKYYPKTIGETRRPINEISLYDYAHTIASLVKSNLAKMIIDGWYEPRGKSKWRILKVNVDVIGLLSKGLKIGDILGYKSEIEETYNEIKRIIEFEYPLGNEIYRDSTGIYFSCPNFNDISKLKSEIIDKLKSLNKLDFSLQIEISDDKGSRSMVILASEREKSLTRISYPHIGNTENLEKEFEESRDAGGKDICPVCRIRLKPERKDRCTKCENRYQGRAKIWIANPLETIWLDEVADKNDRVALIVGQFDLRKWLSGEFIDTFVSQTFDEWRRDIIKKKRVEVKIKDVCNK
ncbi:CRISPR-associated protein Csx11, partial [Candidatus Woesearchaeota archaeon]